VSQANAHKHVFGVVLSIHLSRIGLLVRPFVCRLPSCSHISV